MGSLLLPVLLLLASGFAAPRATQARADIDKGQDTWAFRYSFSDETNARRNVSFEIPSSRVAHDNEVSLTFPMDAAVKAQVAAVRDYASAHKGPKLTVKAAGRSIRMRVTGKDAAKMRSTLTAAKAVAEGAMDEFLVRHKYTRLRNEAIVPDHARLAELYADDVKPVADALAGDAPDSRTYVARALAFVQAIPYESGKKGKDRGYRRPLSVLARNRGDCDSKSALFLALVRARHPELAAAVVYVPNHAFAGVALEPEAGERTFVRDGARYVGLEPVGPAKADVGVVSGPSGWHLFWGSAETRALAPAG